MIIREYQCLQYKKDSEPNYLHVKNFGAIEKFVLENEHVATYLKITTKKGYGKVLQAQNYVGLIQTKDGTTIEILPKIKSLSEEKTKEILIKMLKTLKNSPFKNFNKAHLKSSKLPLLEIFISMFLEELSKLIKKGIKSDYVTKEENVKYLKGKLLINEQIKRNFIHKERFYAKFDEFLSNRIENRLIKTTLKYLYKKSKSNRNQQLIRQYLFVFDDIFTCKDIKSAFSKVKLDRQMKDYEQVLLWCKTFLLENSYSPYKGNDVAFALLFDMNMLFESYVGTYLKKELGKKALHVKLQDKTHHLCFEEDKGRFALKPDIIIKSDDELLIADTKWKLLSQEKSNSGISGQDMYQLYAYGTKYKDCKKMYLVYPKDEEVDTKRFVYKKESDEFLVLNTLFFDMETCAFEKNTKKEYKLLKLLYM